MKFESASKVPIFQFCIALIISSNKAITRKLYPAIEILYISPIKSESVISPMRAHKFESIEGALSRLNFFCTKYCIKSTTLRTEQQREKQPA